MWKQTIATIVCWHFAADAFSFIDYHRHRLIRLTPCRKHTPCHHLTATSGSIETNDNGQKAENGDSVVPMGESYSTLTLLEHMHLLTPNVHNSIDTNGHKNMIDLFTKLGFGVDPKSVESINKGSGEM